MTQETSITPEELRAAVLAALLDYEHIKKDKRIKDVKNAVRGTVMATVLGSSGLMAAGFGRSDQANQVIKPVPTASAENSLELDGQESRPLHQETVAGVAHFGYNEHELQALHKDRLLEFANQLPKGAELVVIGRADSTGGYSYNKKLGKKRAEAVADFLAQQGFNIKAINSRVSSNKMARWAVRRVDVIIRHAEQGALQVKLPPILDLYETPETLAHAHQVKPKLSIIAAREKRQGDELYAVRKILSTRSAQDLTVRPAIPAASPKASESSGLANQVITPKANKTEAALAEAAHIQKVAGVAHFPLDQYLITAAHKERLDLLAKQLPDDVTLTVVGRTDATNSSQYNQILGRQRAMQVANYLAGKGVNITGIGVRPLDRQSGGWMSRRVDVVVSHYHKDNLIITLPPLVEGQNSIDLGHSQPIAKQDALAKRDNRLFKRPKDQVNVETTGDGWGGSTKVSNSRLKKASWAEPLDLKLENIEK